MEYIHSKKIIHRDIKPENLVLDENGYVRITDFGIAKYYRTNNAKETSGTPGYMAPEVMKAKNHSYAVDFFALGIIGYEFMLGRRPYNGPSRREIKEQMLSKSVEITFGEIPNGWSEDAADFCNKLLQRKPELRLGYKGIWELKQHRWMKYFPWDKLINKELESPFIPEKKDNFDKKYCEAVESIDIETKIRYEKYKSDFEYDNLFKNFTYYGIITENEDKNKDINNNNSNKNSLANSMNIKNYEGVNNINIIKIEEKENNNQENNKVNINVNYSNDNSKINKNCGNYICINLAKDEVKIYDKNNIENNNNINKYQREKMRNIATKKQKKNYSFSMKLYENENSKKNKLVNSRTNNDELLKQSTIRSHNNNTPDNYSKNISEKMNINIKQNKNCRSKTPVYMSKKNFSLDSNKKKSNDFNDSHNNSIRNINVDSYNRSVALNQYQFINYRENIRNLFSKKAKQKMNICSQGYYSKHSLQINCNSNRLKQLLQKRNTYISKSPIGSINSNTKSPKITTSTSNSVNGYKKRSRSISPLLNSKSSLRQSSSAKNIYNKLMREKSNNSRLSLNLYNKNFSYVKRIKEMNSFNYNNNNLKKIMSNISSINSIKNKNKKRNNEIISSYSISSANILKQIRNTNYNKNKINNINKNNQILLYKNSNVNPPSKRNYINNENKIRLELELNADSQTFNRHNRANNYKKEKLYKNRKSNSKYNIKNNIINKSNSTINIGSMKMAMNGNININVVIKGNNNTTNLINKIEVKKKSTDNYSKDRNNKKVFERSHSIGYFKLNYEK